MNTLKLAEALVNLGTGSQPFSDAEVQILFNVVKSAGFNPKSIVLGMLRGHCVDQDGSKTGQTFVINGRCPFKVMGEDGDDYFATGWLNDIVGLALSYTKVRRDLVKAVKKEIERSVPLKPIQITSEGDVLEEYPVSPYALVGYQYFVEHTKDSRKIAGCIGVHAHCGGWVDRHSASRAKDTLVCRSCGLRVYFPKKVRTYGGLREFYSMQFATV
jgi:hypothetical protein